MKRKLLLLLLGFLLSTYSVSADTLTVVRAVPIPVENIPTDQLGNWVCTDLKDSIVLDAVVTPDRNDSLITRVTCEDNIYYYFLRNDSLFCSGYENATTFMRYSQPQLLAVFPLHVGDSFTVSYSGQGEYCHLIPLSIEGMSTVVVDGAGSLLLPDIQADGLYRLHVSSSISEILCDTTNYKVDKYIWLGNNSKDLPVFELCETSMILRDDTVKNRLTYYRIPLQKENTNDVDSVQEGDPVNQCAFSNARFQPNPIVDNLLISYHLTRPASIRFTLYSRQGILMYGSSTSYQQEGDYQVTIPMSSLPTDDYVLYIHVDDVILSETIIKI